MQFIAFVFAAEQMFFNREYRSFQGCPTEKSTREKALLFDLLQHEDFLCSKAILVHRLK
jgi:hypothetical protein